MLEELKKYKTDLEFATISFIDRFGVSRQSAEATERMIDVIDKIGDYIDKEERRHKLTADDITDWADDIVNADGTKGLHWKMKETEPLAQIEGVTFEHITPAEWNIAVNMAYADYYPTARKFGIDKPEFYSSIAKDFLFDVDGDNPGCKLSNYYHAIVE